MRGFIFAFLGFSRWATAQDSLNASATTDSMQRGLAVACTESTPSTYPATLNSGGYRIVSCSSTSLRYLSYSVWSSPGDLLKIAASDSCGSGYTADNLDSSVRLTPHSKYTKDPACSCQYPHPFTAPVWYPHNRFWSPNPPECLCSFEFLCLCPYDVQKYTRMHIFLSCGMGH